MKFVKDYMYRDIASVEENSTLRRVIRTMRLHRTCAVPVVNHLGEFIGVISEREILNASVPQYMKSIKNTSFMADLDHIIQNLKEILDEKATDFIDPTFPIVSPTDTLSFAADILYRSNHNTLPVIEEKIFIGFISRIDIISGALNGNNK